MSGRHFIVEKGTIAAPRTRYGVRPDDKALIDAALHKLRHTTDHAGEHRFDVINFVHRQAGLIQAALDRIEVLQPLPQRAPRRPPAPSAAAEAVFAKGRAPARDHHREIVARKGSRVRVIERRAKAQMELSL